MNKIKIIFNDGQELVSSLDEKNAPKTAAVVWNALPIESYITQSRWSGREINLKIGELNTLPPRENQSIYMSIGDLGYWRDWRNDNPSPTHVMAIYYGAEMARSHMGEEPVNVFGQIEPCQMEKLKSIGERIWLNGMESIRVERVL